jgi:hypothetical protein
MISITKVVHIQKNQGTVVGLEQVVEDMANEFIVERQMFRLSIAYQLLNC